MVWNADLKRSRTIDAKILIAVSASVEMPVKWGVKSFACCQKCHKNGTVKYIMLAQMIVTLQFSNALGLFDVQDMSVVRG